MKAAHLFQGGGAEAELLADREKWQMVMRLEHLLQGLHFRGSKFMGWFRSSWVGSGVQGSWVG